MNGNYWCEALHVNYPKLGFEMSVISELFDENQSRHTNNRIENMICETLAGTRSTFIAVIICLYSLVFASLSLIDVTSSENKH